MLSIFRSLVTDCTLTCNELPVHFVYNVKRTKRFRWDKRGLISYYNATGYRLQIIRSPTDLLNCVSPCHCNLLYYYY